MTVALEAGRASWIFSTCSFVREADGHCPLWRGPRAIPVSYEFRPKPGLDIPYGPLTREDSGYEVH